MARTKTQEREMVKDGNLSWVVCFASFVYALIYEGVFFSFGVLYIGLMDEFKTSKRETAWIISIHTALTLFAGPFASRCSTIFGYWGIAVLGSLTAVAGVLTSMLAKNIQTLYLTYGFISGLGHGIIYHASVVCVILSFDKHKALAAGVANVGVGIGMFVISPLVETCLQTYGWRGTVLIEAALLLHGVACGFVYRLVKSPNQGTEESNQRHETNSIAIVSSGILFDESLNSKDDCANLQRPITKDAYSTMLASLYRVQNIVRRGICKSSTMALLTNLSFVLFTLSMSLMFFCVYMPFFFIPDFANSEGMSARNGAWVLAATGIGGTTSRVIFGWLSDRPWANMFVVESSALVLCGVLTCAMPFCKTFGTLLAVAIVYSTFQGCIPVLVSVLIAELTGTERVSQGFGIICWFSGFSNLIGPPIAGWLFDSFGNYDVSFWSFGLVFILSGSILFVVGYIHRRHKAAGKMIHSL